MADLGYVDFYEALSIYRWLDPASVKVEERSFVAPPPSTPTELPAVLAGSLDDAGFFGQALSTLRSEADVERLHGALVLLINKVMAADLVEPGDVEHGKEALARAVGYLGLGLEYLSRNAGARAPSEASFDAARAGQALLSVALERIFRVGFSLTLRLKTLADTLVTQGGVDPIGLDSPGDEVIRALRRRRPEYARALDEPATDGTRAFRTLADIARAAAALERIAREHRE
jgi:hypothetical protein